MAEFHKRTHTPTPKKKDIAAGLWTKCPDTGEMVFTKDLEANWGVFPSGTHDRLPAARRIELLIDAGTWRETDARLSSKDPLKFTAGGSYPERLAQHQRKSGLRDSVVSGTGLLEGIPVSLGVMDFGFMGASMGSVAGEKVTRAIERAITQRRACIVVCASGGARMQEGILSLMQMAKTSAALARLRSAGLPYIAVLTNPTMAGVMASYATLGDVIVAEPRALIGFAGARVIKETTNQDLPEGFQTSEFLLKRGLVDCIVTRKEMKSRLAKLLRALGPRAKAKPAKRSRR
jgi:acetyl-CoA carboxylase carboxyl transferase subunit beta